MFELADRHVFLYLSVINSLDIPANWTHTAYQKHMIKKDLCCKRDGGPWYAIYWIGSNMTFWSTYTNHHPSKQWVLYISFSTHISLYCALVNIGSGNGLAPSDLKPLVELMFTQIYVTIWGH